MGAAAPGRHTAANTPDHGPIRPFGASLPASRRLRPSGAATLFAGVRLRIDAAKRLRRRENALYPVFKIARLLEHSSSPSMDR